MHRSFSQEGEDLVLARLLADVTQGFYVDVGSNHPFRFSNTYLFYRWGWSGVCIDPLPGTERLFRRHRPRDIALEYAVSSTRCTVDYHMYPESALNTVDPVLAKRRSGQCAHEASEIRKVKAVPLADILDRHLPNRQDITFFSVDAEGLDQDVLESNDWDRYRPRLITAECLETSLAAVGVHPVSQLLKSVGYEAYAKTGNSVIFCKVE
jgi:FkbM family methyltransferase